jgi:triosephosphate isomerase
MRQPLVAGNWKMNGSLASIKTLVEGVKAGLASVTTAELAVCPPYVYIPQVAAMLQGTSIALGAQDVNDRESGAHTGEVAPGMLTDVGCKYAIVGHSERRSIYGESDEFTARKFAAVQILYGGSVKGSNAAELFSMADIDGGLIGGASLDARDFLAIGRAGNA